ncbi:MAG: CHAT domain-containing protein [Leptolyngbyaceae cyanobacterium RU_5_1]|nr:CHAT domain-containing protein [Leptolyngbyaceae cyanobacterium RU_5_1]
MAKLPANVSLFLSERTRSELQVAVRSAFRDAENVLQQAIADARASNNKRAEASAMSVLARLYGLQAQATKQVEIAQRGLILSQDSSAPEVAYRLQLQLVQSLRKQDGKTSQVRAACQSAVKTLQALRTDLVNTNQDVQFTFRDDVEPLYRDCIAALLLPAHQNAGQKPSQSELEEARQLVESLQLAELDNFFQEACIEGRKVAIDQIVDRDNPTTAVLYPIILSKQHLGVIAKIPGQQNLDYHPVNLPATADLDKTLAELREQLTDNTKFNLAQQNAIQIYDWLIAPFDTALKAKGVKTLVFVLDGAFRNLPMAALYNPTSGRYLVDDYAIAVNPGLQLLAAQSLKRQPSVLAAGITKAEIFEKYQLEPLTGFDSERKSINQAGFVIQRALVDEAFNSETFTQELSTGSSNIVHLSTHGKFSSRKENTYILMENGKIPVDELGTIFQQRRISKDAIELLVLSACETATGDNRATLGLSGIALKTGVRSTLASLWTIPDDSTAIFMDSFYKALKAGQTKAEAVQSAQLAIKQTSNPNVWAAYILVGNWS